MGETFLSLLVPRSLSAPPCEPSVQGGPRGPGVNAGPGPWTEGHGGLAQDGLMGLARGVWSSSGWQQRLECPEKP